MTPESSHEFLENASNWKVIKEPYSIVVVILTEYTFTIPTERPGLFDSLMFQNESIFLTSFPPGPYTSTQNGPIGKLRDASLVDIVHIYRILLGVEYVLWLMPIRLSFVIMKLYFSFGTVVT